MQCWEKNTCWQLSVTSFSVYARIKWLAYLPFEETCLMALNACFRSRQGHPSFNRLQAHSAPHFPLLCGTEAQPHTLEELLLQGQIAEDQFASQYATQPHFLALWSSEWIQLNKWGLDLHSSVPQRRACFCAFCFCFWHLRWYNKPFAFSLFPLLFSVPVHLAW